MALTPGAFFSIVFSILPLCVALHFLTFSISLATSLAFLASSFLAALATFLGEEGGVDFAGDVGGVDGSGEGVPATELISEEDMIEFLMLCFRRVAVFSRSRTPLETDINRLVTCFSRFQGSAVIVVVTFGCLRVILCFYERPLLVN
ncbi:hypothetical protein HD553DRAFT_311741 [Filobasidium floriforme]|uniref:uncharacterized protein n=1 Tax=Filobasidium floriforme TaxID=5210 RepID=UPI001E8E306C|nr:uncharacterized protein HD553DRAFT_311741 [Filobasidium floriforme]KAH8084800.1 hypothetical protein HD553DRAFT_311741 [Filobasidium floriforme]